MHQLSQLPRAIEKAGHFSNHETEKGRDLDRPTLPEVGLSLRQSERLRFIPRGLGRPKVKNVAANKRGEESNQR
jgi:hypothetical protein